MLFKSFAEARDAQVAATAGGPPTQSINSYTYDELGGPEAVERVVLAAVEENGLEAREEVVAKAPANAAGEPSMLADFQTGRGVKPSLGITVYRSRVVARGLTLSA